MNTFLQLYHNLYIYLSEIFSKKISGGRVGVGGGGRGSCIWDLRVDSIIFFSIITDNISESSVFLRPYSIEF